jgi:hypothetical protein
MPINEVKLTTFFKSILYNLDTYDIPRNKIDGFVINFSDNYVKANKIQKYILYPSALRLLRVYKLDNYV